MKIAVIGAGFAGLATSYWLTHTTTHEVALFDRLPIGEGTSGIAAGLLHPYRSSSFLPNWNAEVCMQETEFLLNVASSMLPFSCYQRSGILRPITHDTAWDLSELPKECEMWDREKTASLPGLKPLSALFLKRGITVDCSNYLKGLYLACTRKGLLFEQRDISALTELASFDKIVIATGAAISSLKETEHLPITRIKGQLLEIEHTHNPLPCPIFAKAYLITKEKSAIIGATFERRFSNTEPDMRYAQDDLMKKIESFSSWHTRGAVLRCKAGFRATTRDHRPLIAPINENCVCITGLGSRGLLYHAYMAKQVAHRITHLTHL